MARGFLSGVLWGGIVSVGVGGVASVLAPLPMPPEVSDASPAVAIAPTQIAEPVSGEQSSNADRAPVTGQVGVQTSAPEPDTLAGINADTVTPAAIPQTGVAEDLQTPAVGSDLGGAVPQGDDPVLPNPQALAPMAPTAADVLSISTEPAQPPAPLAETIEGAFDAPAQPSNDDAIDPAPVLPVAEEDISDPAPAEETAQVATAVVPERDAPVDPAVAEPAVTAVDPPPIVILPIPQEPEAPQTEAANEAEGEAASARPAIGKPAVSLTERSGGVIVNRLTNNDAAAEGTVPVDAPTEGVVGQVGENALPIDAFAQAFDNPDNKPLMGIVLIDDGSSLTSGSAGIAALRSFPYPLSFAVDSSLDDAAERMALYRNEGFEVLAMVDLPEGAAPVDAETTFGVTLSKLPEVVGVLEGTKGGLQGSRGVADQVTEILAQTGHGLITQDKGLNTMPKLARKKGVPADPVFRDFDSKDQTAQVIRRFLDQAAFRANQEGAVIMLGRLRPDTISALLLWGLQDRAGKVSLAPISAVLQRSE
ncbi:divergent polysaccharide deacetylase family protein [Sulfitobacter sp. MF3-043]|uniref:divergent polysaccharide deacetylase family protein n=1 Tax=Sulfitobacter sediminivivens TaxID=3252902 RepID=UPI0036DB72F7